MANPTLLGITKASLATSSFLSAASFRTTQSSDRYHQGKNANYSLKSVIIGKRFLQDRNGATATWRWITVPTRSTLIYANREERKVHSSSNQRKL